MSCHEFKEKRKWPFLLVPYLASLPTHKSHILFTANVYPTMVLEKDPDPLHKKLGLLMRNQCYIQGSLSIIQMLRSYENITIWGRCLHEVKSSLFLSNWLGAGALDLSKILFIFDKYE